MKTFLVLILLFKLAALISSIGSGNYVSTVIIGALIYTDYRIIKWYYKK